MSEKDTRPRKRTHHLHVPVFPEGQQRIEEVAGQAGRSVAAYFCDVGQSYPILGVMDYEKVRELAAINGDLGRLGGLLKLWLTNNPKKVHSGESAIQACWRGSEKPRIK